MQFIRFIEKRFWIPMILASILGILFPTNYTFLNNLVIPLVMIMFFLTCLKIDFLDVVSHIKKPLPLLYILLIYLLVIPAVIYLLFNFVNPELAIGMLLLAAIPPGAASPMLTDIFKGNISLSMAIILIGYLLSPFTILLLFSVLTQQTIQINLFSLFKTVLFVNYFPLIISEFMKRINKPVIEKTKKYYSFINLICIFAIVYIVLATQSKIILEKSLNAVVDTLWLYVLFIILFFVGYFIAFWKNKQDKIAVAVTKAYMNNGLALGIAVTFFSPTVTLLMVLSQITWNTTPGIFKYLLKYFK